MLNITSAFFYFFSFIVLIFYTLNKNSIYKKISIFFASIAILTNIIYLYVKWSEIKIFPTVTISDTLIFFDVILAIMFFMLYFKFKNSIIFMYLLLFITFITIIAVLVQSNHMLKFESMNILLYIHLPFSIIGTAFFFLSAFFGVAYFYQTKELKRKNIEFMAKRVLPMDQINNTLNIFLLIGFIFFTIGLITGFLWSFSIPDRLSYQYKPKLIFSLITWIIFGLILLLKKIKGLPPRKIAFLSILGFVCLIITYIGVAIFLQS
mgnify:CR=1 FL=1|jgi:ABC-type uncharacterized transport system permease subunit